MSDVGAARWVLLSLFVLAAFASISSIIRLMIDSIVAKYNNVSAYVVLITIFIVSVLAATVVGSVSLMRIMRKFKQ